MRILTVLFRKVRPWIGGAADCSATLFYISGLHTVTVETVSFTAAA